VVLSETPVGKLGVTVCYDLRFPELYGVLRRMGAEILLIPAAFTLKTGIAHWSVLLRARAIETQCFVLAAAQVGKHNVQRYRNETTKPPRESYGDACIIDPWGTVIARATVGKPGLVIAKLDLGLLSSIRTSMPTASHRRPDVYYAANSDKGRARDGAAQKATL